MDWQYTREGLAGVSALTLRNPWGLAITRYGKDVENRSWRPPADTTRLFIHAGKAWDPDGLPFLRQFGYEDGALTHVVPSAIVAVADLVGVCSTWSTSFGYERECTCASPWAVRGRVHWHLSNVVPLPAPVPCPGRQRLWIPAPDILDGVAASLASLAWAPLVCRRVDGRGRAVGDPHGLEYQPEPGETYAAMELRARMERWKVGPRPADGSSPDAMCPGCANPSLPERDVIDALRRSA